MQPRWVHIPFMAIDLRNLLLCTAARPCLYLCMEDDSCCLGRCCCANI
jgi:hypothetical protein